MRLKILKWGNYPGLCRWGQCNHESLYKERGRQGSRRKRCDDGSRDYNQRGIRICCSVDFEDGERDQEPRNVGGLLEAGEGKEMDSPQEPPGERQPACILILAHLVPFGLDLQKCERINHVVFSH